MIGLDILQMTWVGAIHSRAEVTLVYATQAERQTDQLTLLDNLLSLPLSLSLRQLRAPAHRHGTYIEEGLDSCGVLG